MKLNIEGTVRNERKPKTNLRPLYEAVANSIDAIEEANESNGYIKVEIQHHQQTELKFKKKNKVIVNKISVTDNGIGFDDINFESFQNFSSLHKINTGGKGKGRFSWLKVFKYAEISSYFHSSIGWQKRKFKFSTQYTDGIGEHNLLESNKELRETTVSLCEPMPNVINLSVK